MAEQLKTQPEAARKSDKPRVLALRTGEGGIEPRGMGQVKTHLSVEEAFAKAHSLEMELDRALGGVVIRYRHRDAQGKEAHRVVLVPLAHCRMVELEAL